VLVEQVYNFLSLIQVLLEKELHYKLNYYNKVLVKHKVLDNKIF